MARPPAGPRSRAQLGMPSVAGSWGITLDDRSSVLTHHELHTMPTAGLQYANSPSAQGAPAMGVRSPIYARRHQIFPQECVLCACMFCPELQLASGNGLGVKHGPRKTAQVFKTSFERTPQYLQPYHTKSTPQRGEPYISWHSP